MNLSKDLSVDKELFSGVYEGKYTDINMNDNVSFSLFSGQYLYS
jgi:hypothetical protein